MINWQIFVLAVLGVVTTYSATATAQSQPDACYDVVEPSQRSELLVPILVNRCTGTTWLLVPKQTVEEKGKTPGQFTYIWHRLQQSPNPPGFIGNLNKPPSSN